MKKSIIYIICVAGITGQMLTGCAMQSSRNYMGTMAGAEIGGVIGEALGWMSTSRHDGPGKAMMGAVIGTVAGAAIGNAMTKDDPMSKREKRKAQKEITESIEYGYQTGGGRAEERYYEEPCDISISSITFQDEDGDGKCSRNETLNIIFEVRNNGRNRLDNVTLKVESMDGDRFFAVSPATSVSMQAGEALRYKAKAFCKSRPSGGIATFNLSASIGNYANTHSILQIKTAK